MEDSHWAEHMEETLEHLIQELVEELKNKYTFLAGGNPDLDWKWECILKSSKMEEEDKDKVNELIAPLYQKEIEELQWLIRKQESNQLRV